MFVANVTGRVHRPSLNSAAPLRAGGREHVGGRAALDLRLQLFEPAKLYVGAPSICGNAARSDAAA